MTNDLLRSCESLALTIAPELTRQPLYVLAADELAGLPCGSDCLGWAVDDIFFDRLIADRLGDRYRGPGNAFALDFVAIESAARPGCFRGCVFNVAIHETAHIVPFRAVLSTPDTPRVRELQLQRMKRVWDAPDPEPGAQHDPHDDKFIRRTIHLAYRAAMHGADFCWDRLFGPYPWMAAPECYLALLLRECAEMSSCTFAQIEAVAPPASFTDQWQSDLKHYRIFSPTEYRPCPTS